MRTCLLVLILAAPMPALAQGTVYFSNGSLAHPEVDAPFYDDAGVRLSDTNYLAQLYAGSTPRLMAAYGTPVRFKTGTQSGYFLSYSVELPYSVAGACGPAWVQVRAWAAAGGATFEQAALSGRWTGISSTIYLPFTGGPCSGGVPVSPVPLIGLQYPGPPLLVSNPQSRKARVGESISFSVIVSGGITVFYQWYSGSSGDTNQPIVGATNSTFVTPPLAGDFSCWAQAWTAVGSTNSATATATVYPANSLILELMVENALERFTIHAPPGKTYQLQSAAGLENAAWIAVTNLVIPSSPFEYQLPMETNASARFYRLSGTP